MARRWTYLVDAVHIYWTDGWRARHPELTRRRALASFVVNIGGALRDLQRVATYQHKCGVLTCERARFWRGRYTDALNENDHLRRHMRLRGMPIPPIRDGHQADHAWLALGTSSGGGAGAAGAGAGTTTNGRQG